MNNEEDQISSEKLELEQAALELELNKAKLHEIRRKSRGQLNRLDFIKAIVAGIVVAGLLAAWIIVYMKPILETKTILNELNNLIILAEKDSIVIEYKSIFDRYNELVDKEHATKDQLDIASKIFEGQWSHRDDTSTSVEFLEDGKVTWRYTTDCCEHIFNGAWSQIRQEVYGTMTRIANSNDCVLNYIIVMKKSENAEDEINVTYTTVGSGCGVTYEREPNRIWKRADT